MSGTDSGLLLSEIRYFRLKRKGARKRIENKGLMECRRFKGKNKFALCCQNCACQEARGDERKGRQYRCKCWLQCLYRLRASVLMLLVRLMIRVCYESAFTNVRLRRLVYKSS